MSNQHQEFPIMTPEARAAHDAAVNAIQNSKATISCGDLRRALAAFLSEAIEQADKGGFAWLELEAIAASIHNSPPPSPTREQMEQALQNLLRRTDDPAGCHEGSLVAEWADTIRRGIAHHCKVQP